MDLAAVMDEVAARLEAVTGLRGFGYPAPVIHPPCAVVMYPDNLVFDGAYARGMDTVELQSVVYVGRPEDRSARDRLVGFLAGSGGGSVKAALQASGWVSCDDVHVPRAEVDYHSVAGAVFLAAIFDLVIVGSGS